MGAKVPMTHPSFDSQGKFIKCDQPNRLNGSEFVVDVPMFRDIEIFQQSTFLSKITQFFRLYE
jgi:hypothetical protein